MATPTPTSPAVGPAPLETAGTAAVCCPRFDPAPWRGRTWTWQDKPFVYARIAALWHLPLRFGAAMTRLQSAIDAAGAAAVPPLTLCDESSPWHTGLYVAVERPLPGLHNTTLSGTFVSRVFEGPYRDVGKWMQQAEAAVRQAGLVPQRTLAWYTTCPKCAKRYGENWVVLVTAVLEAA